MLLHDLDEHDGADDVVGVVLHGLGDGLADRLEPREVDHGVHLLRGEGFVEPFAIENVAVVESEVVSLVGDELLDAAQGLLGGVVEVIDDNHLASGGEELQAGVRADVAGAAGDEHGASFHGSHVVLLGDDGRSGVGWDGAGGRRRDDAGFRIRDECGLCVSVSACAAGRGCARVCVWRASLGARRLVPRKKVPSISC